MRRILLRCPVCGGEEEVAISSPRTPPEAVVEESFCCVPCAGRGTSAQSGVRWFDANGNEVFPPPRPGGYGMSDAPLTMSADREADIRLAVSGRTRYVGRVKPTDELLLDEIDALRARLADAQRYAFENGAIWGYTRPDGSAIQAEALRLYPAPPPAPEGTDG